jgi:hypothetical protein
MAKMQFQLLMQVEHKQIPKEYHLLHLPFTLNLSFHKTHSESHSHFSMISTWMFGPMYISIFKKRFVGPNIMSKMFLIRPGPF